MRDLYANQNNEIHFDPPVEIDGPFYAGFTLSTYSANPATGTSDDQMSAYVIRRGEKEDTLKNRLFFKKSTGDWIRTNDAFDFSAAMMIKTKACLIYVPEFTTEDDISVFPNPTNDMITVILNNNSMNKVEFEVFDIIGRKQQVKHSDNGNSEYTINLSALPAGIYMLKINTNKSVTTKKIVLIK
jgi:hypothetical protein